MTNAGVVRCPSPFSSQSSTPCYRCRRSFGGRRLKPAAQQGCQNPKKNNQADDDQKEPVFAAYQYGRPFQGFSPNGMALQDGDDRCRNKGDVQADRGAEQSGEAQHHQPDCDGGVDPEEYFACGVHAWPIVDLSAPDRPARGRLRRRLRQAMPGSLAVVNRRCEPVHKVRQSISGLNRLGSSGTNCRKPCCGRCFWTGRGPGPPDERSFRQFHPVCSRSHQKRG